MSMTTRGPIFRDMRARWSVRGCSGTGATADRSSRRPAFTYEDREGGTPDGSVLPATGGPYVEALDTRRYDAGASGQFLLSERYVVTARAAVAVKATITDSARCSNGITTTRRSERLRCVGRRADRPGSAALRSNAMRTARATLRNSGTPSSCRAPSGVRLLRSPPACPSQPAVGSTCTANTARSSARAPRSSPAADAWTGRASVGTGFFATTPLTEETEAAGLTRLQVERPLASRTGRECVLRPDPD